MTTKQKLDICRTPQYDIFSELADMPEKGSVNHQGIGQQRRFLAPQPSDITIGHTYLQQHLEQAGQKTNGTDLRLKVNKIRACPKESDYKKS